MTNSRPLAALRAVVTNQMLQDLGDMQCWHGQRLLPVSAQPVVCQQCYEPCFMPLALRCATRFSVSLQKTTSAMLDNFTPLLALH